MPKMEPAMIPLLSLVCGLAPAITPSGMAITKVRMAVNRTISAVAGTGGGNYGMYDNPDVSAKIMEAMQEMDTAKRGEMVKEIDRMVLDDVANIPLFFNENIFGVRDSIEYTPRYDRYLLAWEISFK